MTIGTWITTASQRDATRAVQFKENGTWQELTWPDYSKKILSTYASLKTKGLMRGSHVGIMCSTRWEWAAIDLAVLGAGAVTVPLYPNLSDEDLVYTVNNSDITLFIIENENLLEQVNKVKNQFDKEVFVIQLSEIDFNILPSLEISKEFYSCCSALKPEDNATIIYTSGTTGKPKGVVLTHDAVACEVIEGFALFNIKKEYKSLTFLPFAHVLGRFEHWGNCYNGHCIAYAESIDKLKSNLKQVKPDFIIAVPRIFEKVYAGIMAQIETTKIKHTLFNEALDSAVELEKYRQSKAAIPWPLLLKYEALNKLAFGPIREAFGGKLKFAISGGAPIDSKLTNFFFNCGIPIFEGYGLTETCGAITINTFGDYLHGTVGHPIGEVQIKLASDGEILIKSRKCMKEYYKNPEETALVMIDGYFATGDIGEFTTGGFLKITDRKKDLIKTAGGKYVAPQKLEGLLKQEPLISQVLIHGDQKKYVMALITVEPEPLKQWANSTGIIFENIEELYSSPALKARIQKQIQLSNTKLASYEAIKKFEILRDSWTVENGSLTQSLKVKRKVLEKRYADLIAEVYDIS